MQGVSERKQESIAAADLDVTLGLQQENGDEEAVPSTSTANRIIPQPRTSKNTDEELYGSYMMRNDEEVDELERYKNMKVEDIGNDSDLLQWWKIQASSSEQAEKNNIPNYYLATNRDYCFFNRGVCVFHFLVKLQKKFLQFLHQVHRVKAVSVTPGTFALQKKLICRLLQ